MIKVAILDDYQNVSQEFVNLKNLSGKYEIKIFNWGADGRVWWTCLTIVYFVKIHVLFD